MAMEAQKRVQDAVNKLMIDLDESCLRDMQAKMFKCSANCCEDKSKNMEQVTKCVENCSVKFRDAQTYISNEMTGFQGRLERCALQCQDSIRDKMTADTTDAQVSQFQNQFEQCVSKCADDTAKVVPGLFKKMKSIIDKEAYHKI